MKFREHTIAEGLKGGYQVVVEDINGDGKPDIIALASGLSELVWFENPGWQRHVIIGGRSRMINAAAWDYDGDGIPEIALAEEFSNVPAQSAGLVSILHHNGDPRQPWSIREIDRLPTSHRMRWADIDGSGKKVLVNAPLAGATAAPPDYQKRVPFVFYRPGAWKREIISDELEGILHGIQVCRWGGDRRDDILTASFLGLDVFEPGAGGGWRRTSLAKGNPDPWPKCGSSDVAVGRLGKARFLCAIEPWHGNQVAVYLEKDKQWRRQVIDDTLIDGHALVTADFDGDGIDEIVAGFRGPGHRLSLYRTPDGKGKRWEREPIDASGMAAASCAAADLNGDGQIDLVCIGTATANLKWYENQFRCQVIKSLNSGTRGALEATRRALSRPPSSAP